MSQLSRGLGRGEKAAAPVTLMPVGHTRSGNVSPSLRDFPEVAWPLSIAKASAEELEAVRNRGERDLGHEMRQAAIVIVFAAAAVEAALNAFISRPLLQIPDSSAREFFAKLLHRYSRATVPAKLKFLKSVYPELKQHSELLQRVENLAADRNALIHIYPDYVVALGPTPDSGYPLEESDWVEYPDLQWTKQHVANRDSAITGYDTAIQFIDILPLSLPAYEPMAIDPDGQ